MRRTVLKSIKISDATILALCRQCSLANIQNEFTETYCQAVGVGAFVTAIRTASEGQSTQTADPNGDDDGFLNPFNFLTPTSVVTAMAVSRRASAKLDSLLVLSSEEPLLPTYLGDGVCDPHCCSQSNANAL